MNAGPDLALLTGVRSGKRTYSRAYLRSSWRMQKSVRAIDAISQALVRTVEGPRGLLEEVAVAAADHLDAEWTLLALLDGELTGARPRYVVVISDLLPVRSAPHAGGGSASPDVPHRSGPEDLPTEVARELAEIRSGRALPSDVGGWVRTPLDIEGRVVGVLTCLHGLEEEPDDDDRAVLRTLANQAAVSLYTSQTYQTGIALQRRAQRMHDEAAAQAQDLARRTVELRQSEDRLAQTRESLHVAQQRELIDSERQRIARELHDSVTQVVLAAGMAVEVARGDAEALGGEAAPVAAQLVVAKELAGQAVEQLRRAIYALHQPHRETVSTLPELVAEVLRHHEPHLGVGLQVRGPVVELTNETHHELTRAVAEALFNVAAHAEATRAVVRLHYGVRDLRLSVDDDGIGDPASLSRRMRIERSAATDGRHRGLANIDARIRALGGTVGFRRSTLGGVRIGLVVPYPTMPTDLSDPAPANSPGSPDSPPTIGASS